MNEVNQSLEVSRIAYETVCECSANAARLQEQAHILRAASRKIRAELQVNLARRAEVQYLRGQSHVKP